MAIENISEFVLIIVLIIFQILGVYFAWKIGKILGTAKFWILITAALLTTFLRSILNIFSSLNFLQYTPFLMNFDRIYSPLIFWSFMTLGLYILYTKLDYKHKKRRK